MRRKSLAGVIVLLLVALWGYLPLHAQEEAGKVYDGGYDLSIANGEVLQVSDEGTVILTATYDGGNRTTKSGYTNCLFVYDDGFLVQENREGTCINYNTAYIEELDAINYTGFSIGDESYTYIWDQDARICGIEDHNGEQIAKYIYSGLQVVDIQQLVNGEWTSAQNASFIGTYNKIRSYGAYYDEETGWYYSNGVYDDVSQARIVGLMEDDAYLSETNPCILNSTEEGIMLLGYETDDLQAEQWAEQLLASSSYNAAKASGWYSNSSAATVEIVARMIYGENTSNTTDQKAIAWVVLNRLHSTRFSNDIRTLVANKAQFSGVDSANGRKAQNANDNGWRYATYYACLMLTNSSEDCWNVIAAKPLGFSNQLYFRSASSLGSNSGVYEQGGVLYAHYSSRDVAISNACIAGQGTSTTVQGLKNMCVNGVSKYNVFFYHN